MKKPQALIASLCLLILLNSCKKDIDANSTQDNQSSLVIQSSDPLAQSTWKTGQMWTTSEESNHTVFTTTFDDAIDSKVMANGLIRVFKATLSGENIKSLPFSETVDGVKHEWYYQVSDGKVSVSVNVFGSVENPAAKFRFNTVVFNSADLAEFEKSGKSKIDVMNASYESIQTSID